MTHSFDRLLRDALEASHPDRGGACLDADTVAAWCDGTLDASARAAAEAHMADCARCQAFMAAMIRTEPPPPVPWWRSRAFGWMAPLAVAAASVLIWVNLPSEVPQNPDQHAAMASAPPSPAPPAVSAPEAADAKGERSTRVLGAAEAQRATPSEKRYRVQSTRQQAAVEVPAPSVAAEPLRDRVGVAVEPPALPAAPPSRAAAAPSLAAAAPRASAGAPPPTAPEPVRSEAPQGIAETVSVTEVARQKPAFAQPELVVSAPDVRTRWRLTTPGSIQRTTDNGATWEAQSTGEAAVVTAGDSPANTVCWLVGRAGLVLLSTDGRTWTRLKFPERRDLVAVVAADDKRATVRSVTGRTFTTADGGVTWK